MVPSGVQMPYTGRHVRSNAVLGLEIGGVLIDPIVDGVDCLNVFLVQFEPKRLDNRVLRRDPQAVGNDLLAEVPIA